ncbi:DNA/RNA nuclease SfsA, partial [Pseudoalteromonas sp. S186]
KYEQLLQKDIASGVDVVVYKALICENEVVLHKKIAFKQ